MERKVENRRTSEHSFKIILHLFLKGFFEILICSHLGDEFYGVF